MKKIRIGIIGCGSMSRYHGKEWLKTEGAQVAALCDPDEGMLDRYRREVFEPAKVKAPPAFADYREMLDKVELDGVMIITPHTQHFDQATDALNAGCHLLVEKPMVVTSNHARKLIAHAKRAKRVLSVAFPQAFTPEFAYGRSLIQRGDLGEVVTVNAFITQSWKRSQKGMWRQDPRLSGGGFAYDSGAHMFNAMIYLPDLRVREVYALVDNRDTRVDIASVAVLRYEKGVFGTAMANGDADHFEEGIYVSGTRGAIRTGFYGGRFEQWGADGKLVRYPRVDPVPSMHRNFVDCILGRAETPCPGIWGLRQSLLMEAFYASARTSRPAKVEVE